MLRKKKILSPFFKLSFSVFILSLSAVSIAGSNAEFAAEYSKKIGAIFRFIPLSVSNLVPISVFEIVIYCSPFLVLFLIIYCTRGYSDKNERLRRFFNFIAIFLLVFSFYLSSFSVGYFKENERRRTSVDELVSAAEKLSEKLKTREAEYSYDLEYIGDIIYASYVNLGDDSLSPLSVSPRPKQIKSQYLFTKLGILGMYSFASSEILINPASPEYTKPFTIAHEMAHFFGISREDSASFSAYLALKSSGVSTLEYSAEISALQALLFEIYKIDPGEYSKIYSSLPEYVKCEFKLYRDFYSGGYVTELSSSVNDKLISAFDKEGAQSYSYFAFLVTKEINGEACNNSLELRIE